MFPLSVVFINAGEGKSITFLCEQRELSTKLVLNAVSTGAHVLKGKIYQNHMIDLQVTNTKLYRRATRLLQVLWCKMLTKLKHCITGCTVCGPSFSWLLTTIFTLCPFFLVTNKQHDGNPQGKVFLFFLNKSIFLLFFLFTCSTFSKEDYNLLELRGKLRLNHSIFRSFLHVQRKNVRKLF